MTGSHADSIVHGGVYDGALGVVGAVAAVKGLRDSGFKPKRTIQVVQFTSEEGDRFSEVCFGRQVSWCEAESITQTFEDSCFLLQHVPISTLFCNRTFTSSEDWQLYADA